LSEQHNVRPIAALLVGRRTTLGKGSGAVRKSRQPARPSQMLGSDSQFNLTGLLEVSTDAGWNRPPVPANLFAGLVQRIPPSADTRPQNALLEVAEVERGAAARRTSAGLGILDPAIAEQRQCHPALTLHCFLGVERRRGSRCALRLALVVELSG